MKSFFFLCYVKLSLTWDSLCFGLWMNTLWNLYNNHQHIPLTPFPSILGICFFSVSWWEFFFFIFTWSQLEFTEPPPGSDMCLPGETASKGQAALPLESCFCYLPVVFPIVHSMKILVFQHAEQWKNLWSNPENLCPFFFRDS